jgi:DnaJ-class molecular chaperone
MDLPDYYEVLQVSANAEPEVLQAAYKRLAFKYHPDRNHDSSAHAAMKALNEAYEVLSDSERRKAYDVARRRLGRSVGQSEPHTAASGRVAVPAWLPAAVGGVSLGAIVGAIASLAMGGSASIGGVVGCLVGAVAAAFMSGSSSSTG